MTTEPSQARLFWKLPDQMDSMTEVDQARISQLMSLGFRKTEAEVFVGLLRLGRSSGKEIAHYSSKNREETYRALQSLRSYGLVEISVGATNTYSAVEPTEAIDNILKQLELKHAGLKEQAMDLSNWLKAIDHVADKRYEHQNSIRPESQFFRIVSGIQMIKRVEQMLIRAKHEILRVMSADTIENINMAYGIHMTERGKIEEGTKIRIISDLEHAVLRPSAMEYLHSVQARWVDALPVRLNMIDRKEVIVSAFSKENGIPQLKNMVGLWTNNEIVVDSLASYFELLWERAKAWDS